MAFILSISHAFILILSHHCSVGKEEKKLTADAKKLTAKEKKSLTK